MTYAGLSTSVPITVRDTTARRPPSFLNDVEPLFTRLGCNQGSCHGKGAGQNGFRLSLRGYAPELDHQWLTREFAGRRTPAQRAAVGLERFRSKPKRSDCAALNWNRRRPAGTR